MSDFLTCPNCKYEYAYSDGTQWHCPDCGHEWNAAEAAEESTEYKPDELVVKDANGNVLQNGDTVVVVKDLPVKGFLRSVKAGTKVKNIRLTDGDHNIDCTIGEFGAMALKSEFVKKA